MGLIGDDNAFESEQSGDNNEIHIVDFAGDGNEVEMNQNGDDNTLVVQMGDPESAFISNDNIFDLSQDGMSNEMLLTTGELADTNNNEVIMSQEGDFNLIDLMLEGSDNLIDIMQLGEGNEVVGIGEGAFSVIGSGHQFTVSQTGINNVVQGSISGTNNAVSITQVGEFNLATVNQQ